MAQTYRDQIIVSWDNFDYNQNVRHQTLREPAKHISATSGKLCIGHYIPDGGLHKSMLHPEVALDPCDITLATGNQDDEILHTCQRYWIAEAIRYTHRAAVEDLFSDNDPATTGKMRQRVLLTGWPELPTVERLPPRKTPHYSLGPILENEGTISGTYSVIDAVFTEQLGYDPEKDFNRQLHLVYGDQKTVSLIRTVQKERQEATLLYDQYNWFLAVPGLFHWRTNYMDMIHDTYSGSEHAAIESTLYHNKNYLGCVQGEQFCSGFLVGLIKGGLSLPRRGMACGDGEVGRGRANQVNMRHNKVLDVIYHVRTNLSWWLGLHGIVNNRGLLDAYFQERVTYPTYGRFLKFVHIPIQLVKAKRNSEPDF